MTNLTNELTENLITQKVNNLDFNGSNIKEQIIELVLNNVTSTDQFIVCHRLQDSIDELIKANTQAYTQLMDFEHSFMVDSVYNNDTEIQEIPLTAWCILKIKIKKIKGTLAQTD